MALLNYNNCRLLNTVTLLLVGLYSLGFLGNSFLTSQLLGTMTPIMILGGYVLYIAYITFQNK